MPDEPSSSPDPAQPFGGRQLSDTQTKVLLRMLHSARQRGDRAEAAKVWERILLAELQRVRGMASSFRRDGLPGSGGRIPAADVDDIVIGVFFRLQANSETLRGQSIGELRNFMRKATTYVCLDYVREHVRRDKPQVGSLDDDAGRVDIDRALRRHAEELSADGMEADLAREVIHQALAFVDDDKRMILVMDQFGYTIDEITERTGIGRDNVYARRSRGLKQLGRAIRELNGEDDDA